MGSITKFRDSSVKMTGKCSKSVSDVDHTAYLRECPSLLPFKLYRSERERRERVLAASSVRMSGKVFALMADSLLTYRSQLSHNNSVSGVYLLGSPGLDCKGLNPFPAKALRHG